jgi:HAD superfamily hydrolase (TIGR01509 family)
MVDFSKIKAVIFDMDGVLLDSETIYKENNKRFFAKLGIHVSDELYNTFIGLSATLIWQTLKNKYYLPEPIEYYKKLEKEDRYHCLGKVELQAHENLLPLLQLISENNLPMAVASMSSKKNIELVIHKLNISHYFSTILSGEDVVHGKPNPEIFLKASTALKVNPEDCVVIEDSKNGIQAAKSAGMKCIGYINPGSGNQDLSKADWIIKDYQTLIYKQKEL